MKVMLDEGAFLPERGYEWDAGHDLRTPKDVTIPARGSAKIDTGVHIDIPYGFVGMLKSKSGLNVKHNIIGEGVIDAGFTGSIVAKLYNLGDKDVVLEKGSKIIQIVIAPICTAGMEQVEYFEGGERGSNGFGSTGK